MNSPSTDAYGKLGQSYMISGPNGNAVRPDRQPGYRHLMIIYPLTGNRGGCQSSGRSGHQATKAEFHYINALSRKPRTANFLRPSGGLRDAASGRGTGSCL